MYGILLNGIFYADTIVPAAKPDREWKAYFGLLDASSSLSDGLGTVQEAFSHASQVEGLDFFAVTDHSDSFDNAVIGGITRDGASFSAAWAARPPSCRCMRSLPRTLLPAAAGSRPRCRV